MRAAVAVLLSVLPLLAGCFGAQHPGSPAQAPGNAIAPAAGCDHPLLTQRVRAREMDLAADPTDGDNLAAGLIVSLPSTRDKAPHDWPFWDGLARSSDGGKTWTLATLPGWEGDASEQSAPWAPSVFLSDPIVLFTHDGHLLLSILAVQPSSVSMYILRYPPGAMEPESIATVVRSSLTTTANAHELPISAFPTIYNDKEQMGEDPATGDLFVTWFWRTDTPGPTRGQPMLSKSTDGGRTWSAPVVVTKDGLYDDPNGGFNVGSWPFVTLDGKLHVVWWDDKTKMMWQADSPDHGASFGPRRSIADAPTSFDQPGGVIQLGIPSIDVDRSGGPHRGNVYVTWEDRRNGDRDVFLLRSTDDGATWSSPQRVNADPVGNGRDQFMPQLTVAPDGTLGIIYMDRSADPANKLYVATVASSTDGGATFAYRAVASVPSDVGHVANNDTAQPDPLGRSRLGDYVGIAHNKDGLVALWQDAREGTAQLPYSNAYVCALGPA